MNEPTYPDELPEAAASTLRGAANAVSQLRIEDRNYTDPENIEGRVKYDYNNQPYEVVGETKMMDDAVVQMHDGDAVITFHYNGTQGQYFDGDSPAQQVYDTMSSAGLSRPIEDYEVGVQIRGNDIYVQNILRDATE